VSAGDVIHHVINRGSRPAVRSIAPADYGALVRLVACANQRLRMRVSGYGWEPRTFALPDRRDLPAAFAVRGSGERD